MRSPKEHRDHYKRLSSLQDEIRRRGLFNVVRGELMDIEALERAIEEDDERIKAKEAE